MFTSWAGSWIRLSALAAMLLLIAGGCQPDKKKEEASKPAKPVEPAGPKKYELSELTVQPGEYQPAADDGRVEIAAPKGWKIPAPQVGILAWFTKAEDSKLLPQIRVTADDLPSDAPTSSTPEDVKAFAKWLEGYVQSSLGKKEQLLEPVVPLIIGDHGFGRYVRGVKYRGALAERQVLNTVSGGRMYTIELIVPVDTLKEYRDASYAVAGSLKFAEVASETPEPDPMPATDPPAVDPAKPAG